MARGYSELPDGTLVPTTIAGSIAEHKAIVWLQEEGYEVYKNVNPTGQVDMIAVKDSKIIEIDVKMLASHEGDFNFSWATHLTKDQIERGVKPLFVYKNTVGWNRDYF